MLVIPTRQNAAYRQTVTLDGAVYGLRIYWNTRDKAWFLDIASATGESLLHGVKLVVGWELIGRFVDEQLPPGRLAVVRVTNAADITRDNLGTDFKLIYLTESEL